MSDSGNGAPIWAICSRGCVYQSTRPNSINCTSILQCCAGGNHTCTGIPNESNVSFLGRTCPTMTLVEVDLWLFICSHGYSISRCVFKVDPSSAGAAMSETPQHLLSRQWSASTLLRGNSYLVEQQEKNKQLSYDDILKVTWLQLKYLPTEKNIYILDIWNLNGSPWMKM